jgi:hypothetical protein
MLAAAKDPGNPGIALNAGALIAWYNAQQERPEISDDVRRAMDKLGDRLNGSGPVGKSYKEAGKELGRLREVRQGHEEKILTAEAKAEKMLEAGKEVDRKLAKLQEMIGMLERRIRTALSDAGHLDEHPEEDPQYRLRARLYAEIRHDREQLNNLKAEHAHLLGRGKAMLREYRQQQNTVKRLKQRRDRELARQKIQFRWAPPAVDGKITYPEPSGRKKGSDESSAPADSDKAARTLRLARLYLSNGMQAKAKGLLERVVRVYPDSPQAATARKLLADLEATSAPAAGAR